MKPLLQWGIELRFWVAFCVASLGMFSHDYLTLVGGGVSRLSLLQVFHLLFFATLCIYNLDGTLDTPLQVHPRRHRLHLLLSATAFVAFALAANRAGGDLSLFMAVGFVGCAAYATPVLRGRPVKALPFIKAPFVGTAVAGACVGVPVLALLSPPREALTENCLRIGALLLSLVSYCTANALLFDVPDVHADRAAGVPTAMSRRGLSWVKMSSISLSACGVLFSVVLQILHPRAFAFSSALLVLGLVFSTGALLVRETTSKQHIAFWIDGSLMLPWVLSRVLGLGDWG